MSVESRIIILFVYFLIGFFIGFGIASVDEKVMDHIERYCAILLFYPIIIILFGFFGLWKIVGILMDRLLNQ